MISDEPAELSRIYAPVGYRLAEESVIFEHLLRWWIQHWNQFSATEFRVLIQWGAPSWCISNGVTVRRLEAKIISDALAGGCLQTAEEVNLLAGLLLYCNLFVPAEIQQRILNDDC